MELQNRLVDSFGLVAQVDPGGLILWLRAISDALIWFALIIIAFVLAILAHRRRHDMPFPWMYWMFAALFLASATTHLIEVVSFFTPVFRLVAVITLLTAGVSVVTASALVFLLPGALTLRGRKDLEREIGETERAKEALRQSEERFRPLVEATKDYAIFMLDPNGYILTWNSGAERIKGYRADEILGQHFSCFYTQEDIQQGKPERKLEVATAEGRCEDEGWRLRKDGSRFWANAVITVLRDEAGNVKGFSKITRDLTERKRMDEALRTSEERFRALLESAPDAMVIVRKDGKVVLINKQAEQLFGYKREELLGQPVEVLVPERFHGRHADHRVGYFANPAFRPMGVGLNLYGRRKDGTEFPVEISLSPLATEEGTIVSSAIRDITNRKRAEEKLAAFSRQVQRSNRELEQFASIASHDLQEPLRKIQAFGDRLQSKCGQVLGEQGRDYLKRMQSAAARMQAFINNLLTFSRLTAGSRTFVRVDLTQVVHEVLADLEDRVHQTEGRVDVGQLPTVEADPMQMRQLLQNLISNSLKFHRPQQPPLIQVQGTILENGHNKSVCQITVQDNGIGFEEAYLDRIFEAFQRLHGPSEFEGTGMGLTICRRIVERHGGSITARSAPGQGAIFVVSLPAKQPEEEEVS
jgi:PAS domain S-box-containing protein